MKTGNTYRTIFLHLGVSFLVLVLVFALEVLLMTLANWSFPNHAGLPFADFLAMFKILWNDQPWGSLVIAAQEEVLVISHIDAASGTERWGIYFYPLKLALLAILVFIVTRAYCRTGQEGIKPVKSRQLFFTGIMLLIFSVSFVRVSSCCSGPAWAGDVMLRVLSSPDSMYSSFWAAVYPQNFTAFLLLRLLLAVSGFILLMMAYRNRSIASTV